MINQVDLMAVVEKHRDNGVVVPTMTAAVAGTRSAATRTATFR